MLKLCQILFGHVVGFASRNALSPVKYGYLVAMLALLGLNSGHLGAHDDAMWAQFGGYNSGIAKNHPKLHLQNSLPHGPRGVTEETPKPSQKQHLLQNANPHGRQAKTHPKIRLQKTNQLIPMAGTAKRTRNRRKRKAPLLVAKLFENGELEAKSPNSTQAVWADFMYILVYIVYHRGPEDAHCHFD